MMFWILTAALTAAVVAMLLRGLLRGEAGPGRASYDMAVYRDQLAELERERAQGLIGPAEAESAKAEIARRMLAVADAAKAEAPAPLSGFARSLSTILLMALPAAAIAIYLNLGNPGVPGQPFAERQLDAEPATRMAQAPGQAPGQPAPPAAGQQPGQPGGENGAGDLAGMAGRLAERLRAQPDDVPGWMLLGQTYMQLGRFPEGGSAYRQAYERAKTDPAVIGAYAEALVMTNSGTVSPEAEGLLREALKLRGDDPRARFYLALGQAQQGQLQPALDGLAALIKDSPADAPWLAVVQARAGEIAQQLGRNPAELPKPLPPRNPEAQIAQAPAMPAAPAAPQRGPTAADIQAAQDMTPEQRSQMVEGMVSGLAARLEQNPADVEGWLRLARAYGVMGKPAEQVKALARAAQQAPNRPDVQTAYADALLATLPAEGAPSADE
ncbi:MAG TPA: c-type cytochrome biogenesis protein CcmI, partial [Alphaproteobacteria bacterium]|nr:c-type cytochrome biogenesis protein CcmI [Alphaproteobacteria bacterium]